MFLDTNIALRLVEPAAPEHGLVCRAVARLEQEGRVLSISAQILVESWVVFTRPKANNGFEWSATAAGAALDAFRTRFVVLQEDATTLERWFDLVTRMTIVGKRAHDARIAALMASHGVTEILTLNVADFHGMPGIVAVHPSAIAP